MVGKKKVWYVEEVTWEVDESGVWWRNEWIDVWERDGFGVVRRIDSELVSSVVAESEVE